MSGSSEEFSSPSIVEGSSPTYAPAALRRQNADISLNDYKSVFVSLEAQLSKGRKSRLQQLGFGPSVDIRSEFAPKCKRLPVNDVTPRVEWTKFFSNVWNVKPEGREISDCETLEIHSDTSFEDSSSALLFGRSVLSQPLESASQALGTASIERKYPSPPLKSQKDGLLVTKLKVSTADANVGFSPIVSSSSSKSTPPYVDPRLLMRRKMMMRPSLSKKLVESMQKDAEEEHAQIQADVEKAAAEAEKIKTRNMKLLSDRRKMMMRPSKAKQIAEMESKKTILEAAVAQLEAEKLAIVLAAKQTENARRLAVRRKMMQRPSKSMQLSLPEISVKQTLQNAIDSKAADTASPSFESTLDELIHHFSIGLKKGVIKIDSLVGQIEPARSRGNYQSPMRRTNSDPEIINQVPAV
jgi:hypothetical protein